MSTRPQLLGLLRGACGVCFHPLHELGLPTVPPMFAHQVHSPLCRSPLQSSFTFTASHSFRNELLPTLVLALARCHHNSSTIAEDPSLLLRSVLRCSQPLDGLLQTVACEFVPPRYRVQDRPVQGFIHFAQPPHPHRTGAPSLSLAQHSLPFPKEEVHEPWARLRGFDPYKATCHLRWSLAIHRDRSPLQVHFLRSRFKSESQLPNSPSNLTP